MTVVVTPEGAATSSGGSHEMVVGDGIMDGRVCVCEGGGGVRPSRWFRSLTQRFSPSIQRDGPTRVDTQESGLCWACTFHIVCVNFIRVG